MSSLRIAMKLSESEQQSGEHRRGTSKKRRRKQEARSKSKRRGTKNRTTVARSSIAMEADDSDGFPPPSAETRARINSIPVETQRKRISQGHRVLVRVESKGNTLPRWRGGQVTGVGPKGARIRIKFDDDGTCFISDFPDVNLFVDLEATGHTSVSNDGGNSRSTSKNSDNSRPLSSTAKGHNDNKNDRRRNTGHCRSSERGDASRRRNNLKRSSQSKVTRTKAPVRKKARKIAPLSPPTSSDESYYAPSSDDVADPPSSDSSIDEYLSCRENSESSWDETERSEPTAELRKGSVVQRNGATEHCISVEQQRNMVKVGHRVKVLFGTKARRNGELSTRQWYYGDITHVLSGGSKVRIAYDDGDSEISHFPDQDVVLVGVEYPQHDSDKNGQSRSSRKTAQRHLVKRRRPRNLVSKKDTPKSVKASSSPSPLSEQQIEEHQKSLSVGMRLKVELLTKSERNGRWIKNWRDGEIVRIMAKGSKILVKFDENHSEIFSYPDDSIVLLDDRCDRRRDSASSASSRSQTLETEWWKRRSRRPDFYFASPWNDEQIERELEECIQSGQMSIQEQRTMIAVGQKVKVLFVTELERGGQVIPTRKWYTGRVTEKLAGGSKIRILYNDGTSEVTSFPDQDVELVGEILVDENHETTGERWENKDTPVPMFVTENHAEPSKKPQSSQAPTVDESTASGLSAYDTALDEVETAADSKSSCNDTPAVANTLTRSNDSSFSRTSASAANLSHENVEPTDSDKFAGGNVAESDEQQNKNGSLAIEAQRRSMVVGQKLKVQFEVDKRRRWFVAVVTRVLGGGSMLRVEYNDGSCELLKFPNEDIVVLDGKVVPPHAIWSNMFELLVKSKEHGHCDVKDPMLSKWISRQRALLIKGQLSPERVELLESIGFLSSTEDSNLDKTLGIAAVSSRKSKSEVLNNRGERSESTSRYANKQARNEEAGEWNRMFGRLLEYQKKHGDCHVRARYKADPDLAKWVLDQRRLKKRNRLSVEKVDKLESAGFSWDTAFLRGRRKGLDKKGNSNGKVSLVHSGVEGEPELVISTQPQDNCKRPEVANSASTSSRDKGEPGVQVSLSSNASGTIKEVVTSADSCGPEGASFLNGRVNKSEFGDHPTVTGAIEIDDAWNSHFERLRQFKEEHGHVSVRQKVNSNTDLGRWVGTQRMLKRQNRLSAPKVERLKSIGFDFNRTVQDSRRSCLEKSSPVPEATPETNQESPDDIPEATPETNQESLDGDIEMDNAFTPEEDELILRLVLGTGTDSSDKNDFEKMRLLASYSPEELMERAMELQHRSEQDPAVGSVGYRVQSSLQEKPKEGESVYRAVRIR